MNNDDHNPARDAKITNDREGVQQQQQQQPQNGKNPESKYSADDACRY